MKRILTGIRPTGPLHLGHFVGALKQWIKLQDDYECYFLLADIQALTTHADNPKLIQESIREVTLDMLSVGLDPLKDNVNFVLQSAIPEISELTTYFTMVTPFTWIQKNPTIKEELKQLSKGATLGFMNYPVSQAADILMVSPNPKDSKEPVLVPVGNDQVPHIESTNRVSRAFNSTYGETFGECKALVGDIGRFVGLDGNSKMSKSLNNAIYLKDSTEEVKKKIMSMYTDPKRIHPDDPGTVEGNPVFIYHDAFNENKKEVKDLKERYEKGTVGDVEVKEKLFDAIENFLEPIRQKRKEFENEDIMKYVSDGTKKAQELAAGNVDRARKAMGLDYPTIRS
ncbi:tryptophan--tRNA ligase [Patescibacteria group bacterium]